ncbi:MAG: hypothetical protein KAW12_13605 [Candidatus Aminicenantes bacterium]|nr:hypothetical protein [Candidatus Aminicenantes bacterium]
MDYLIFNELSFPFQNKYDANEGIKLFVQTFGEASAMGINQLRLHKDIGDNLYRLELAPGYLVSHWLQYGTGEPAAEWGLKEDIKNRFREIMTSAPLITGDEPIEKEENERSIFEIPLPGEKTKQAEGLGAAYLLDTAALSFLSADSWDTHKIENLKRYFVEENGADVESFVEVKHASRPRAYEQACPMARAEAKREFSGE